jgi:hypothetical protein
MTKDVAVEKVDFSQPWMKANVSEIPTGRL